MSVFSLLQAKAQVRRIHRLQRKAILQRRQLLWKPLLQRRQRRQPLSRHLLQRRPLLQRRWSDCKAGADLPCKKSSLGSIVGIVRSQQSSACCSCPVDVVYKAATSVKKLLKKKRVFFNNFLTVKNYGSHFNLKAKPKFFNS